MSTTQQNTSSFLPVLSTASSSSSTPSSSSPPTSAPPPPEAPQTVQPAFPPGFLKKLEPYLVMDHPDFSPTRPPVYSLELVAVSSFRTAQEWDDLDKQLAALQHKMDKLLETVDRKDVTLSERGKARFEIVSTAGAIRKLLADGAAVASLRGQYLDMLRENHLSEREAENVLQQCFGRNEFISLHEIIERCLRYRDGASSLLRPFGQRADLASLSFADLPELSHTSDADSPDSSFSEDDDRPVTPTFSSPFAQEPVLGIEQALSDVCISCDSPALAAKPYRPYCLMKHSSQFARSADMMSAKKNA